MNRDEYEIMARVEQTHPWFVNRRLLVRGLLERFLPVRGGGARRAGDGRPLRLLDAGSGTGLNLSEYAAFGQVVGIEYDAGAARRAARRGGAPVVVGNLCRLPFGDARFDAVVSTDVIEHIETDVRALAEMARVLAPGGRILITTPAYAWAYSDHDRHLHHVRRYDLNRLSAAFRRAGLRPLHLGRYNVLLATPLLAARWWAGDRGASDVAQPIPRLAAPVLDFLWHIEACLAQRLNLGVGLTHLAVLTHASV